MKWCEGNGVYYVLGLSRNSRLLEMTFFERINAQILYLKMKKASRVFGDFRYQTRDSWPAERRVVYKTEHPKKEKIQGS